MISVPVKGQLGPYGPNGENGVCGERGKSVTNTHILYWFLALKKKLFHVVYLQVIRVTQGRLDNQDIPDITDLQGLKVASVDRQAFLGCLASLVHVGKVDQRD